MNIEKMREEFEAWANAQEWTIDLLFRDGYVAWETQFAFEAWQASSESLMIELPERDAHELSINAMFGYDLARKDAIRAIEATGLKVK